TSDAFEQISCCCHSPRAVHTDTLSAIMEDDRVVLDPQAALVRCVNMYRPPSLG
ncbi:hypothetical protein BaRGS_00031655, partial [Batillaria attramentaria]